MKEISVVVALIFNQQNQLLIAKRPDDAFYGGYWEFPGGKIEKNETAMGALSRELVEEVDVRVLASQPFMQFSHQYPEILVHLDVWQVTEYAGMPHGKEGQWVQWCDIAKLEQFKFLEASKLIIEKLRLQGCIHGVFV